MKSDMTFWINIIEKMNSSNDIEALIPSVLSDLCKFLGYGFGFVYKVNPRGTFELCDSYTRYAKNELPATIDPQVSLGDKLTMELAQAHKISFRGGDTAKTPLEEQLSKLFDARSMDLVPITYNDGKLIALVGIADRRNQLRVENENTTFTHSILFSLATFIKASMYQKRVEAAELSLRSIMDNMGIDIYVNDFETHEILYVNRSMAKPYGGVDDLMGRKCWAALYDDKTEQCEYCPQKKLADENGEPTKIYSWDYKRPFDGSWFRVLSAAFRWVDGRLAHVVSSVDITENKRNEEMIRRMAEYDQLTGLPNRHKLTIDCEKMVGDEASESFVLFLDLDGFKQVNDTLGHHAGDALLRLIGEKFQSNPLTRDRTYRYGGDEFVILCDGSTGSVKEIIDFLQEMFPSTWHLDAGDATCGTSVGITHCPVDSKSPSELIRNADHAMYISKSLGKGIVSFYNRGDICTSEVYGDRLAMVSAAATKTQSSQAPANRGT